MEKEVSTAKGLWRVMPQLENPPGSFGATDCITLRPLFVLQLGMSSRITAMRIKKGPVANPQSDRALQMAVSGQNLKYLKRRT
jgi:hypothetical protein